jgi:hypothetical protein
LYQKKNGKWGMCVDYMSLNKTCPKDSFPLPRIDQVVDLTVVCVPLIFLDGYLGYHQIPLTEADQPATMFSTRFFLLFENVILTEERKGYISTVYAVLIQRAYRV